jgi:hypothetical protein
MYCEYNSIIVVIELKIIRIKKKLNNWLNANIMLWRQWS